MMHRRQFIKNIGITAVCLGVAPKLVPNLELEKENNKQFIESSRVDFVRKEFCENMKKDMYGYFFDRKNIKDVDCLTFLRQNG